MVIAPVLGKRDRTDQGRPGPCPLEAFNLAKKTNFEKVFSSIFLKKGEPLAS